MSSSSIFFSTIFLITFLFVPHQCATLAQKSSPSIVNKTCGTCTRKASSNFSYNFCYASLAVVPISHSSNLEGLGLITLELALDNASSTISSISGMLSNGSTPQCNTCLASCLELYLDISIRLEIVIEVFMSGRKQEIVYQWVSEIIEATSICEAVFMEKGDKSPITKENHDLSQLCGMVLCIIDMIDLDKSGLPNSLSNSLF